MSPILREANPAQKARVVYDGQRHRRGRPKKVFDNEILAEAFRPGRNITITAFAKAIGVHRNTLSNHLKAHGLQKRFHSLPNTDLDKLVKAFKEQRPNSGLSYLVGHIRRLGIRVQRRRLVASTRRVDGPLGTLLRQRVQIVRRVYHVTGPNGMSHMDGHHKLIRWGFVIHGLIDGYSRLVSDGVGRSSVEY